MYIYIVTPNSLHDIPMLYVIPLAINSTNSQRDCILLIHYILSIWVNNIYIYIHTHIYIYIYRYVNIYVCVCEIYIYFFPTWLVYYSVVSHFFDPPQMNCRPSYSACSGLTRTAGWIGSPKIEELVKPWWKINQIHGWLWLTMVKAS